MTESAGHDPARTRQPKSRRTRLRILGAAREVFGEVGYAAATFQAIAARSGITRPAISFHFADKRALYHEVIASVGEDVYRVGMARARTEPTLMAKTAAFAAGAKEAGWDAASLLVTSLHDARHHRDLRDEARVCEHISRRFVQWAIADAIEHGEIEGLFDDRTLAEALLAILFGFHFYVAFVGDEITLNQTVLHDSTG